MPKSFCEKLTKVTTELAELSEGVGKLEAKRAEIVDSKLRALRARKSKLEKEVCRLEEKIRLDERDRQEERRQAEEDKRDLGASRAMWASRCLAARKMDAILYDDPNAFAAARRAYENEIMFGQAIACDIIENG